MPQRQLTRRHLLFTLAATPLAAAQQPPPPLAVPIHRIVDSRALITPAQFHRFWSVIWPEATRILSYAGLRLQTTDGPGEIRRSPASRPVFTGLRPAAINLVLTDHVPMYWDRGRSTAGVTTIHDGFHICLLALPEAHPNQVPFFSTNTCVHEFLHALMQDVFVTRPGWFQSATREARIDSHATGLWLFHSGSGVHASARTYLTRLR